MIGILSAIVFCMIYGVKILNPTYTDWLLKGSDLTQHYLGWEAYRASAWHFPLGICLLDIQTGRRLKRSLLLLCTYLLAAVAVTGLFGGFTSGLEAAESGLGCYSFNMNAFFNSFGYSCIFQALPSYGDGQYEGNAYLGAGCIILLFLSVVLFLGNENANQMFCAHWKKFVSLCAVAIVSLIAAVSPVITMNDKVLLTLRLPERITKWWSVFRASGRIGWVSIYIIMLCSCVVLSKILNKKTWIILASCAVLLQIYDIHEFLASRNAEFCNVVQYNSVLKDTKFWAWAAKNKEIEHIVYASELNLQRKGRYYSITNWAMKNGKTVSDFYFARSMPDLIAESRRESLENPSKKEIFIFIGGARADCVNYNLHYYEIDGMVIGYADKIDGFSELPRKE